MIIGFFNLARKPRQYRRRECPICKNRVKWVGYGWVSHGRKHVREGIVFETKMNGRIVFRKIKTGMPLNTFVKGSNLSQVKRSV